MYSYDRAVGFLQVILGLLAVEAVIAPVEEYVEDVIVDVARTEFYIIIVVFVII